MSSPVDIEIGGAALVTGRFYAYPLGVKTLTDPSTLELEIMLPDGTTYTWVEGVDAEIVHLDDGLYQALVPATDDGVWRGRWVATGDVVGAKSFTWCVRSSAFV